MALFDVVRFDSSDNQDWLIYKYPEDRIITGSQLIVQEGQTAVFVLNGAVADAFEPGRYVLSTENLPLLNKIIGIPFGGKSPFSAEIYFINTVARLTFTWGTPDPIQLLDPNTGNKIRVRAFGQVGICVVDALTVFAEVIGSLAKADVVRTDKIKEFFRGILIVNVKAAIADAMLSEGMSVMQMSARLEDLSLRVAQSIAPQMEQYGFALVDFHIQSINLPDGDIMPNRGKGFCPYCGKAVQEDFVFCPYCGKRL